MKSYLNIFLQLLNDLQSIIQWAAITDEPGNQFRFSMGVISFGKRKNNWSISRQVVGGILEIWRDDGGFVTIRCCPIDLNVSINFCHFTTRIYIKMKQMKHAPSSPFSLFFIFYNFSIIKSLNALNCLLLAFVCFY